MSDTPEDGGGMVLNVLDFGADPTGQRSSARAFKAAIAAAEAGGGGTIYVPAGNFNTAPDRAWKWEPGFHLDPPPPNHAAAERAFRPRRPPTVTIRGGEPPDPK